MAVCKPGEEVGRPVVVAGADDQVNGRYERAAVEVALDGCGVDGVRVDGPLPDLFQDRSGGVHDLVPAAVGYGDVDEVVAVLPGRLLCCIDCLKEVCGEERAIPDHPHPDAVLLNPLVVQDRPELLFKE